MTVTGQEWTDLVVRCVRIGETENEGTQSAILGEDAGVCAIEGWGRLQT